MQEALAICARIPVETSAGEAWDELLALLLKWTGSEFGFVGEVLEDEGGRPYLKTCSITNIAWNAESRRFYDEGLGKGGLIFAGLETLFGEVLRKQQVVLSNAPAQDPRAGGLPAGHPPLRSFLGLPVCCGREMVGMVGVANRPGGFAAGLVEDIQPILDITGQAIASWRSAREAQATRGSWREERSMYFSVLDSCREAVFLVGPDRRIRHANRAAEFLMACPASEVVGLPLESVLRLPADIGSDAHRTADFEFEHSMHGSELQREFPHVGLSRPDGSRIFVDVRLSRVVPAERGYTVYFVTEELQGRSSPPRVAERRIRTPALDLLVRRSPAMRRLSSAIEDVAQGGWPVLIEGETGSGKEAVARALHELSDRRERELLVVNCAALTDSLGTSQLFGHRRGAFTSASRDQPGVFEAAMGGSVLLDEIGDISPFIQRALLRVIETKEVTRIGESQVRPADVRILAATNRDLKQEVQKGRFREDLYYRLDISRLEVPALRKRREDIDELAALFLEEASEEVGRRITGFSARAMRVLRESPWPGNVRQLRGAIASAVLRAKTHEIQLENLPPDLVSPPLAVRAEPLSVGEIGNLSSSAIRDAMLEARGNRTRAARLLGISRSTLYRRLKSLAADG